MKQEHVTIANESILDEHIKTGDLIFLDCDKGILPDLLQNKRQGTVKLFSKYDGGVGSNTGVYTDTYASLLELREKHADVFFLDKNAVKVLFAQFPVTAKRVLVRMRPRFSWIVGIPGLLRRLWLGLVRIEGVVSLPLNGKKRYWLALEHLLSESLQVRYSLSKEVGIQGLLEYLHKEDVAYVVLRFFDSLPELHREGGDLDILISDHDEEKVRAFLQEHPGTIGVDVRTPSRSAPNSVTYYPPPIAREIIESAIDGPARSKIPAPREAFLSFAYHIVYHKGLSAGVPTDISGLTTNPHPENDYKGTVEALARNAGIVIDATMELLDEYLKSEGWQPKPETLIKIAPWNKWVRERFFAAHQGEEIGLSVFILKKKASERGIVDAIIERIQEEKGFKVIAKHVFTERETRYVARHLRGGVWDDHSGAVSDFLPGVAVVVVDMEMLTYAKMGVRQKNAEERVRKLKRTLRSMFDTDEVSLIHATDHTHEAYDYITHCFPREKDTIRDDIRILQDSVVLSRFQKVQARLRSIPFMIRMNLKRARQKILGTIVRWVME